MMEVSYSSGNNSPGAVSLNHLMQDEDTSSSDSCQSEDMKFDPESLTGGATNDITAQLVAAGTVGRAAAAAIASGNKRKHPYSFETNPSVRKRQQTRLLRKLKAIIDEYSVRVGQQAVVLVVTPGKLDNNFKTFGTHPLENVVRKCKDIVMQELENALTQHIPVHCPKDSNLYELPPLIVDGIPTPVEKMTQAQLRTFIPLMLRYSTGRGKPGWGRESTKPLWWPEDLPWASVRSDARNEEQKLKVSWTHALRQIVVNCYKHHGREDLLINFTNDKDPKAEVSTTTNFDEVPPASTSTEFQPAVLRAVNSPGGSVSIIQMDTSQGTVVTLPDGTQAEVLRTFNWTDDQLQAVSDSTINVGQNLQGIINVTSHAGGSLGSVTPTYTLELKPGMSGTTLQEATVNQDGQIIFTASDGSTNSLPVASVVTIPAALYQTLVSNVSAVNDAQSTSPCIATVECLGYGNEVESSSVVENQ